MRRRAVLAGCVLLTGFSGCVDSVPGRDSDEPVASLALVEITNRTGESVEVDVEARKNGNLVHDDQYAIEGITVGNETDHGYPKVDGVQIVEDWMASAAEFEFRFTLPEYELETTFSSSDPIGTYENAYQRELQNECYFVRVEIGDGSGNATPETVPERIGSRAIVYDHDVFDRRHAGECT